MLARSPRSRYRAPWPIPHRSRVGEREEGRPDSGYHVAAAPLAQPVAWPAPGSHDSVVGAGLNDAEMLIVMFALVAWLYLRVEIRPALRRT
jgi:hypothetical protein